MSIYKKVKNLLYSFTKKGKEEKYWLEINKKTDAILFDKGLEELKKEQSQNEVKKKCIAYVKAINKKKHNSNFHLATLTNKKFKNELANVGLKIDFKTLKFKNA